MARVTQLGYVGLGVSNVEEWEHFATDILGLESNGVDADGNLSFRMDENSHRFIIQPTGKDDLEFVGWQVTDEQALREMAEQLQQAGIEVADGTDEENKSRRVEGMIKFEDPDGTATEIFTAHLSALTDRSIHREPSGSSLANKVWATSSCTLKTWTEL